MAASKMIYSVTRKKNYEYAIISVNNWLSSIAGIIFENMVKIPAIFLVHPTR